MKSDNKIYVWEYIEEYKKNKRNILNIVDNVFNSGQLILGKQVRKFENNFSRYVDCKYGVGVNSGTDALLIALMAVGVKKYDEVVTVSNTAVPTVSAIVSSGAIPVYVDIDDRDFLLDTTKLEQSITKKTKAIIAVNLYGQSCNYDKINKIAKKYNIKVIEDCAQSAGAMYKNKPSGSMGDLSAFSFYPTKNLGGYGDGGMVITNNKKLYNRCLMLRKYGMKKTYYSELHGINSRLDEVQAAILNFKLKKLNEFVKKRRNIANIYNQCLKNTELILPNENKHNYHSYYVYVVRHKKRKKILDYLSKNKIFCNISYPYPIHSMKGYRHLTKKNNLRNTNLLAKEIFSLPMYPELSLEKVDKVIKILKQF